MYKYKYIYKYIVWYRMPKIVLSWETGSIFIFNY